MECSLAKVRGIIVVRKSGHLVGRKMDHLACIENNAIHEHVEKERCNGRRLLGMDFLLRIL